VAGRSATGKARGQGAWPKADHLGSGEDPRHACSRSLSEGHRRAGRDVEVTRREHSCQTSTAYFALMFERSRVDTSYSITDFFNG
jgi:hypothetical protein